VNLSGNNFYLAREFPNPLFSFKVVIASFEYDLAIPIIWTTGERGINHLTSYDKVQYLESFCNWI